jgi:hypothetical protein
VLGGQATDAKLATAVAMVARDLDGLGSFLDLAESNIPGGHTYRLCRAGFPARMRSIASVA